MERWKGRVAMVTGANSGIGAGVTQRFLESGLTVVGVDHQIDNLQVNFLFSVSLSICLYRSFSSTRTHITYMFAMNVNIISTPKCIMHVYYGIHISSLSSFAQQAHVAAFGLLDYHHPARLSIYFLSFCTR